MASVRATFAELPKIDFDDLMLRHRKRFCDRIGGHKLVAMPLAIIERQGIQRLIPLVPGNGQARRAVQSPTA